MNRREFSTAVGFGAAAPAVPRALFGRQKKYPNIRSLRPLPEGRRPKDWRESMYYRYWMHLPHFRAAAHFGVRTKRYKLIYYYGLPLDATGERPELTPPEWELFDLEKDPKEMKNVYDDPAYAGVVKKLKKELRRLRKELEDDKDGVTL